MDLKRFFGLTFLVLCFAGVLIQSSASPFSFEAVQDALKERFRRQDDHGHDHEGDHEGENSAEQLLSVSSWKTQGLDKRKNQGLDKHRYLCCLKHRPVTAIWVPQRYGSPGPKSLGI